MKTYSFLLATLKCLIYKYALMEIHSNHIISYYIYKIHYID